MNQKINIVDLGRIDYQTAWDFQKEFHKKVQHGKETDTLFLLEHDPVYTLGKNANKNNLLEQPASEVKVFNVERGGDITYHGPGQLVGYPILDLHHYQTFSELLQLFHKGFHHLHKVYEQYFHLHHINFLFCQHH